MKIGEFFVASRSTSVGDDARHRPETFPHFPVRFSPSRLSIRVKGAKTKGVEAHANTTPTLLQAIRQDPDTGLRWAMRDYAALVRGIARRILPGHDRDIEECTADVFVALWRNAARLEATGTPVRAWLIVTARNTAINRYRALQRHDTLPLTDELAATIADLPADPAGDAADELAVLVAALEPPDREIFLRKYYLMQSSREIAAALDLRVSTVNTRLSRGRDRLRRQLQERGYTHG